MGLPVACVEIGILDGVARVEHPAVPHIDAAMGHAGGIVGAGKEHKVAGLGAVCPGGYVV